VPVDYSENMRVLVNELPPAAQAGWKAHRSGARVTSPIRDTSVSAHHYSVMRCAISPRQPLHRRNRGRVPAEVEVPRCLISAAPADL